MLQEALAKFVPIHGRAAVDAWLALGRARRWDELVAQLLQHAVAEDDALHGIVAYLTVFFSVW